jgi:hypothetical protein
VAVEKWIKKKERIFLAIFSPESSSTHQIWGDKQKIHSQQTVDEFALST